MRIIRFYLLALIVFACESNNQTSTEGKGNMDTSIEKEEATELAQRQMGKGADKFKGEYHDQENGRITGIIREYPGKPDQLAFTLKIGSREPGTVGFYYDEAQDALSSKKAEAQRNFSMLRLDESGNRLIEVYYDPKSNTTDTTIYIRTE